MQFRLWLSLIVFLIVSNFSVAQDFTSAFLDLGVFEGEVEKATYRLAWENDSKEEVRVKLDNIGQLIKGDTIYRKVAASEEYTWDLTLDLPENAGIYFDSILVVTQQDVVARKFYFQYQVLQPEIDVFKAFRNQFWPFRAKEQVFNLKSARRGDTLKASFDLYNFGGEDLELVDVSSVDSIKLDFLPHMVDHDRFTKMSIEVPTYPTSEVGFVKKTAPLISGNDTLAYLPIQYTLLPVETDSKASLGLTKVNFDYRVVKKGEQSSEVIFLSNNGSESLEIEKVESNCECLRFELSEDVIEPGDNAQLKVVFDFTNREGLERKTLAIFSNDGKRPVQVLTFKAHVK